MNTSLFFGGSVLAAAVAGMIALFAPCCISVMLPAYFASSFQNRRVLTAMTFVFAAGIATVILPIALGASFLRQLFVAQHTLIYVTGGGLMVALALYLLFGGSIHLPMPGKSAGAGRGVVGVYSLGLFSGTASSCCAPVLAGLIALSGLASSTLLALGLGLAYVFGMVVPLFIIALLWERRDWRNSRLFRPRVFSWGSAGFRRQVSATNLATSVLLTLMGLLAIWVGFTQDAMSIGSSGWQADFSVTLQIIGRRVTDALAWLPNSLAALLVILAVLLLGWRAMRQVRRDEPAVLSPEVNHEQTRSEHAQNE